jgi:hypothetical protein
LAATYVALLAIPDLPRSTFPASGAFRCRFFVKIGVREMDFLSLFGLFAVAAMLVTYALEDRSRWFILAFAGACLLASLYGFLQGAWPFGIVEAIWSGVALYRWRTKAPS